MNKDNIVTEPERNALNAFIAEYRLTDIQVDQFKQFLKLLLKHNQEYNLTAITDVKDIIDLHFRDSLIISNYINFQDISMAADIGSGAGFPGIPLAIIYPQTHMLLLEVNTKKIAFLESIKEQLILKNIEVIGLDWRTFLRKTTYPIQYFFARASLHPDELIRMFKPSCFYNNAHLVYWAAYNWQMGTDEASFFEKEMKYQVGNRKRKLIFFKRKDT